MPAWSLCSACLSRSFPNIADPQIQVTANYTGADANTVAQSVATPIEQQMAGVDGMNYMYSQNASNGQMSLTVDFGIDTVTNTDQILSQMRVLQANCATAECGPQQRCDGAKVDGVAVDVD